MLTPYTGSYNTTLEAAGFDIACNESTIPYVVSQEDFVDMIRLHVTGKPKRDRCVPSDPMASLVCTKVCFKRRP